MFVTPGFEGLKIVSPRKDGGREGALDLSLVEGEKVQGWEKSLGPE